ncbi:hypothetical protein H4S00_001694 [Coemansia sp. D1744]|nr:hypothetical protein H4S00_001694 [Coemansia sp. D1744]
MPVTIGYAALSLACLLLVLQPLCTACYDDPSFDRNYDERNNDRPNHWYYHHRPCFFNTAASHLQNAHSLYAIALAVLAFILADISRHN